MRFLPEQVIRRLVFEIIAGIRARCRPVFSLGLRVSPERFGLELGEMREFVQRVLHDGRLVQYDDFEVAYADFKELIGWKPPPGWPHVPVATA